MNHACIIVYCRTRHVDDLGHEISITQPSFSGSLSFFGTISFIDINHSSCCCIHCGRSETLEFVKKSNIDILTWAARKLESLTCAELDQASVPLRNSHEGNIFHFLCLWYPIRFEGITDHNLSFYNALRSHVAKVKMCVCDNEYTAEKMQRRDRTAASAHW